MKYHLIVLLCFWSTWTLAQQTTVTHHKKIIATDVDWWKFQKDNYSILYPQDWKIDTSKTMGSSFILFAPVEGNQDGFKENINLLTQDFTGKNVTLSQYVQFSEDQIKRMIKNAVILDSKRIKLGDNEFHQISFTGTQANHKLRFEQRYYLRNQKSYVLTFTYEQIKAEQYQKIGDLLLTSFQFIE